MTSQEFNDYVKSQQPVIEQIRLLAYSVHDHVNQTYDKVHPYGFHLDMVVSALRKYGSEVCQSERDVLPLFFGAFFHDSIEDARLSYNDVKKYALRFMDEEQALMAAEIVYALTNDKGRTRAERAGEKYYAGIRETPYAPFVKLCDRDANITYSFKNVNAANERMKGVYHDEQPLFLKAINAHSDDPRQGLPQAMIDEMDKLMNAQ